MAVAGVLMLATACSVVPYQHADTTARFVGGHDGYLDKQVAQGVFVIEVSQIGGYEFIVDHDGTVAALKQYWLRRASELCPQGYDGEPEVIHHYDAKLEEFRCELRYCQKYPLISGYAKCKGASTTKTP